MQDKRRSPRAGWDGAVPEHTANGKEAQVMEKKPENCIKKKEARKLYQGRRACRQIRAGQMTGAAIVYRSVRTPPQGKQQGRE